MQEDPLARVQRTAPLSLLLVLLVALLAVVSLGGCVAEVSVGPYDDRDGDKHDPTPGMATNSPIVGVSEQGLGFVVRARDFSADERYGPLVRTSSVSVATTLFGYGGGTATVEVRDATGAVVMQQELAGNVAQGNATVRGTAPFTVALTFRRFTGSLSLAVGAQQS